MNMGGFEIERKYLIRRPPKAWLAACTEGSSIIQTYLVTEAPGHSDRVRRREDSAAVVYTHTEKRRISDLRREEHEREISESEYNDLLRRADPGRQVIEKRRHVLMYEGQCFEIDIYPFWADRAVMEIELEDESQPVRFPPEICIIKEISGDRRYTNAAMAKDIPFDALD